VIPHTVADTSTFQGNPLPPHSGYLTQKTPCRTPSCWWVRGWVGLRAINLFPNFPEPSLPRSQNAETDRNCVSNYILFNSQSGVTVSLLELQPLMVLLSISKITGEAIWIMNTMVINRKNWN